MADFYIEIPIASDGDDGITEINVKYLTVYKQEKVEKINLFQRVKSWLRTF